jgi:hypothetical protein
LNRLETSSSGYNAIAVEPYGGAGKARGWAAQWELPYLWLRVCRSSCTDPQTAVRAGSEHSRRPFKTVYDKPCLIWPQMQLGTYGRPITDYQHRPWRLVTLQSVGENTITKWAATSGVDCIYQVGMHFHAALLRSRTSWLFCVCTGSSRGRDFKHRLATYNSLKNQYNTKYSLHKGITARVLSSMSVRGQTISVSPASSRCRASLSCNLRLTP